jgi:glutamyl-tRNA synthetase
MKEVRVRFAPSPTGFLHVGGARTAIFNWLFARNKGGKFLLRIEDTDPERSKSELTEQILRSMRWLGMDADEPIVYQALNINRHREIANELLKKGKAYYAFETPEELEAKRNDAKARKVQYKYDRASLKLSEDTIKSYLSEGKPHSIRFKVPEGVTEFEDLVHGKTTFNNSEIDDFIILRSDGSPIYQIAVVVDDNDMNITHVIRGDDHLSNTPKQIMLYEALEWEKPEFAHLPMILDEQKKKLSKRKDPVAVEDYKEKGYLPEALFNFLTLLGFAPPLNTEEKAGRNEDQSSEKIEIASREDFIKMFTFERVNKKSAVFDKKKLNWINSEYIQQYDENLLADLILEDLQKSGIYSPIMASENRGYVLGIISLMKERVSTINDFTEFGRYFFIEPDSYDRKALAKYLNLETKAMFEQYFDQLKHFEGWTAEKLDQNLRSFAEIKGIKAAQIIHLLRLSLTGISISPGIFELMVTLGRNRSLDRINCFLTLNQMSL